MRLGVTRCILMGDGETGKWEAGLNVQLGKLGIDEKILCGWEGI